MTTQPEDMYAYFDDIEDHIEQLELEESILCDCGHRDALTDRIAYLKIRKTMGDTWVDNDRSASPGTWETLETFTETEAIEAYNQWTEE